MSVSLNIAQRRAVEHVHGPMLVLAGAGTGKTTVLVERIVALIEKGHANPDQILAVTFMDNAAAEIRERVAQSVGPIFSSGLKATTFHGYCFGLLKEAGRDFGIVTKEDLWVYLRRRLRDLGLVHFIRANRPGKFLTDLITFFERCQDDLIDAAAYEAYVQQVVEGRLPLPRVAMPKDAAKLTDAEVLARCQEIARVFRKVEQMLADDKLGMFGHMISGAVALLREDPARLERERSRARFLLIDEFQDSNIAQIELAQLLAGEPRNIFAVGDPDQAIYKFRGATSAAFDEFLLRFPGAAVVSLEENQRSTRAILQCAFHAIRNNPVPAGNKNGAAAEFLQRRPLESARAERARAENKPWQELPVEMVIAPDAASEAADIAESIQLRRGQLGCRWRDFAVLYRQHAHREELLSEFAARDIPVAVEGVDVLDTQAGRDLLAILRAIASRGDAVSLLRLASLPQFGISGEELRELLAKAGKEPNLEKLLEQAKGGPALRTLLEDARRFVLDPEQKVTQVLDFAVRHFRMEVPPALLLALRAFLADWEKKPITKTRQLREFLQYLEHFAEAGGSVKLPAPAVEDGVRLMTAHNAKGLEFAHVFVPRVSSSSFPSSYNSRLFEFPHELGRTRAPAHADSKTLHLEEELRVFYVAITRARDSLTLSGKRARGKEPVPSRFLRELSQHRALASVLWRRDAREYTVSLEAGAAPVSAVTPWMEMAPRVPLSELPLSASAIEMYERCPLQFKIARDWNLPAEPAAPMQFGAAVHTVLHDYFRSVKQGEAKTREQVLDKFREEMAKGKFDDALQRELYEKQGVEQISAFLASTAAGPAPEVLDTERSFRINVSGVNVNGRVDRLDRLDDNKVRIVDYKTGRPRDQEDADKSLQLSLYAIAAREAWGSEPASLVFYNLETNAPVETFRNPVQLLEVSDKVRDVASHIAAGDFPPKPDYHCTWCPYRALCPVKEQRLYTIGSPTTAGVQ